MADPDLRLHASLRAVADEYRTAQRTAAIAAALRDEITERLGGKKARLALATYNMGAIADRLAATANYDGLAVLLDVDLVPIRLAGGNKHTCPSKGAGGKYTAGCPRCDELKAQPKTGEGRGRGKGAPRQRTAPIARTAADLNAKLNLPAAPVSPAPAGV